MVHTFSPQCVRMTGRLIVPIILSILAVTGTRAEEYARVVRRWDIGPELCFLDLNKSALQSSNPVQGTGIGMSFGVNFPIIFSDSSDWAIGLNPSVSAALFRGLETGVAMNYSLPILATFKYGTDARLRPLPGWQFGWAVGAGYTLNALAESSTIYSNAMPTLMAEINVGKHGTGFPGLLKLRCMKQMGDMVHNGGSLRFSTWHLSLMITTSY